MAWYSFTGNNTLGHPIQGRYNAESELVLMGRLQAAGITAVSFKKLSFFQASLVELKQFGGRIFPVKKTDLSIFYYQLADMLEAGIPLKNALFVIANHLNNPRLIQVIHDIIANLAKGASFSEALQKYERLFSSVTLQLISFAQSKEELTAILRYCDQSIRRMTFARKVFFVAMPQFSIMIVLFMALFFLRFHYLRDFYYAISVFKNPVPITIRCFDIITGLLSIHLLKTISIIFFALFGFKILIFFSKKARLFYHAILCYFPVVAGVILAVERERLALLYSVLLKGGTSVQKCAHFSVAVVNNLFFRRRVKRMSTAVHRGEIFSNTLRYFHIFSSAEVQMIALGAASNSLVKTFERIYSISQMILERRLLLLLEFIRLVLYILNASLFFFGVYVTETLFFYPGVR